MTPDWNNVILVNTDNWDLPLAVRCLSVQICSIKEIQVVIPNQSPPKSLKRSREKRRFASLWDCKLRNKSDPEIFALCRKGKMTCLFPKREGWSMLDV